MPKHSKTPPQPIEVPDEEKLEMLNRHCVTGPGWESLDETQWCLHCTKTFTGRSIRVYRDPSFPDGYSLECGTPGCDGTPLDWHSPESEFAKGVTKDMAHAELMRLRDKPVPEKEPAPPENDPDWEDTGTYGPEIAVTPRYQDEAQRLRLHPLLWSESAENDGEASGHPDFMRVLCQGAKAGMIQAYTAALGKELMDKAKIAFPARVSAMAADNDDSDDLIPEQFWLEVEYGDYEEEGAAASFPDLDAFDHRLAMIVEAETTEDALVREIRLAIASYLAQHGAAAETLEWEVEIDGFGG